MLDSATQDTAECMLKAVLLKVFELAGSETDHVPPVMVSPIYTSTLFFSIVRTWQYEYILYLILQQYDFEISNAKKADDRDEVYSRVSNLPALINLGS